MSKNTRTRILLVAVAALLLVTLTVGGTLAWLADESDTITNVFTTSDINVKLEETKTDFEMIPGSAIDKDPVATVLKGSVDSWLFVKLVKNTTYNTYLEDYVMATGWIALTGVDGVYYREVSANEDNDQEFQVLANDQVTVKTSVTKKMMEDIINATVEAPTLTITAYAVQKDNLTVEEAWNAISDPDVNSATTTTPEGYAVTTD